jgi:uncharacterized membrane-anchored protein YitT (DUF2179 family)
MHVINKHTKKVIFRDVKRLVVVIFASIVMALNIKFFVKTAGLYPGGATGLTILIQAVFKEFLGIKLSYTIVNVILNAIPAYIGFKFVGKKFTILSVVMILLNGLIVDILPAYCITKDILLVSVFGGIINGIAISMCLSVDATSGGTDFISIYLSQKRGIDSFNVILGFNVAVLISAGLLFGWNKALYSIIFQYVSTQTLKLLYRNYQQVTLYIITDKPKEICNEIYKVCRHGASIMDVQGSYQGDNYKMVYSVVSASDAKTLVAKIKQIDCASFINCINTQRVTGNFYYSPKD